MNINIIVEINKLIKNNNEHIHTNHVWFAEDCP